MKKIRGLNQENSQTIRRRYNGWRTRKCNPRGRTECPGAYLGEKAAITCWEIMIVLILLIMIIIMKIIADTLKQTTITNDPKKVNQTMCRQV